MCLHTWGLVLACLVVVLFAGCGKVQRPVKLSASPGPSEPSAQQPIIQTGGWTLVFGGKDGTLRKTVELPEGSSSVQISASRRCVAALVASLRVEKPYVLFYNVEGAQTGEVFLPRTPRRGLRGHQLWVGDRQEAVVWMEGSHMGVVPGQRTTGMEPETYYLNAKGEAAALGIERIVDACFPRSAGFAVIAGAGKDGWRLVRYSAPGTVAWERTFPKGRRPPRLLWYTKDADIAVEHDRYYRFTPEGAEIK